MRSLRKFVDYGARLTLLGHVAVEVLLGPEAAEEVLSHVQLGSLHGLCGDLKNFIYELSKLIAIYTTSLCFK